jgi:hypothetical protein
LNINNIIFPFTFGITGFLCVLNIVFVYLFRKRRKIEELSYLLVALLELGIFLFALLLRIGIIHTVPYHLPPHLVFNRAEIGAAIAIGIGLFPVGYWHRTSASELRARMAQDAKVIKERDGGVRVRSNAPGEWMN